MDRELHIRFLRDMVRAHRLEDRLAQEEMKANGGLRTPILAKKPSRLACHTLPNSVTTWSIHALVRSIPMRTIVAELFGKHDGWARHGELDASVRC
jgi:pyruvate dehydrogenase E1 component alpha subunit